MMPNDNIQVVRQYYMVVTWIRLRQMKKLKETKPNGQFTRKNSKLLLIKFLIIIIKKKNVINNKSNSNNNNYDNNNNKIQRQIYNAHNNQH